MAFTGAEKSFCVPQFAKCESMVIIQCRFRTQHHKDPPTDKPTRTWYNNFKHTGSLRPAERTVTGPVYLDMFQQWLIPQLQEDSRDLIYQEDGASPHFHHDVRGYLNDTLPHRWIECASQDDSPLPPWSPRSPDLTPCDFLMGLC